MTYISREAAIEALCKAHSPYPRRREISVRAIQDISPSDVKEVIHGKWEWDENGMDWGLGAWKCSECKAIPQTWWNANKANPLRCSGSRFCGNCGADMRKVVEIDQVKEAET